ncbi:hypothetical protein HQ520_13390, partial [bacterium]|nr:hypothetical protein [bacterium]
NYPLLPDPLKERASIQCESCHGAGSQHLPHLSLEGRGIAGADLAVNACAQCHDSASGYQQKFYQWEASAHTELVEGHASESASCAKCHTGEGFVAVRAKGEPAQAYEDPHAITCATCHDPHYSDNAYQLRVAGDFTFDSGQASENAGLGGLCMNCHNSRVSDPEVTAAASFRGSHHGPQGDMLLGINGVGFDLPFEPNSWHSGNIEEACVGCHMTEPSGSGSTPPKVGGHTFGMRDDNGTPDDPSDDMFNTENACGECHGPLASYDRGSWGDYDGNGDFEGVQTEIHGLFDILREGILTTMAGTEVDEESGRIGIDEGDFANLTPEQKRAMYNFNFVWEDGSFGIHNTAYAVQLLQRAYEGIFGRPISEDYPRMSLRGPITEPAAEPATGPGALADIEVLAVSPRQVALSGQPVFDEVSSGLNVVGVGQKVYMRANPRVTQGISGYQWAARMQFGDEVAVNVDPATGVATMRPPEVGKYRVFVTPVDGSMQPTTSTVQLVFASSFAGSGLLNVPPRTPRLPECSTGFCHGGNNADERLGVASEWVQSRHASKLQTHLDGSYGSHYDESCLPCHTTGFDEHPEAVNNGFDDIADNLGYDLAQIPELVEDAAATGMDHFPDLPMALQSKASVQCESCHGPGAHHPLNITEEGAAIAVANLDPKQCAQCHDSASGFQQGFYQWQFSAHTRTNLSGEGHVGRSSCAVCHFGEGFVNAQVNGQPAGEFEDFEHGNPVTCATCHDPHFTENHAQLRLVGAATLPSGDVVDETNSGAGGLCMRCHNSRVADVQDTALNSFRGPHHGPQADMWKGVNGAELGLPVEPSSFHSTGYLSFPGVPDSCVFCHMADPPVSGPGQITPPFVGSHTYSMRDERGTPGFEDDDMLNVDNTCNMCHADLEDYDRRSWADYDGDGVLEGTQSEVEGLFDLLRPRILATMPGTSVDSETGVIGVSSGDFGNLEDEQKLTLYNYNFCWEDGSFGIHNTAYTVQLLQRSVTAVYGVSIEDLRPDVTLRGPVPPTPVTASEGWLYYE